MIFEHKLVEYIDFKYRKATFFDKNSSDFIKAEALVFDEKKEEHFSVGEVSGYFFDINDSENTLHDILDSISGDTNSISPYFDHRYNKVIPKIQKLFDFNEEDIMAMSSNFIYLHMLEVDKEYRGKGIGKLLISAFLNDCRRNACFAFLNAIPLQFNSGFDQQKNKLTKKEFKDRNEKESKQQLIKFYTDCGFKLINKKKTDMVASISELYISEL
mgnify:CR=1 FL=1